MRVASLGGEYRASTAGRCELIARAAPASTPAARSAITATAAAASSSARPAVCHGMDAGTRARAALPGRPVVDRRDFVIYGLSLLRRKELRSWERRPRRNDRAARMGAYHAAFSIPDAGTLSTHGPRPASPVTGRPQCSSTPSMAYTMPLAQTSPGPTTFASPSSHTAPSRTVTEIALPESG